MCLILLRWQPHTDTPLVVAANRDEMRSRGSRIAALWPEAPDVLAGRDLTAGGTWLGITRGGRFAALTNYRDPSRQRELTASRGELVANFLTRPISCSDYLKVLQTTAAQYNGYNLVFGDGDSLWCYSNVEAAGRCLPPGIYGLSNHLLDTPWPKVAKGKSAIAQAIDALPDRTALFDLLRDDTLAPDHDLPRTGVSLEWERLLSAAFIRGGSYGTRSSTVLVQNTLETTFEEITWSPEGAPMQRVVVQLERL